MPRLNREDDRRYASKRHQERRSALEKHKREHGCVDCGTKEGVLDYDHRDKATKLFNIATATLRAEAILWAEVAKCDVRCRPCHMRRHVERGEDGRFRHQQSA